MTTNKIQTQEVAQVLPRDVDEIRIRKDAGFFGVTLPIMHVLPGTEPQTAGNYTAPFFCAHHRSYRVIGFKVRWETKAGAAATLQLRKVPNGTAPASGTALLGTAIDMTQTENAWYTGTLVETITGGTRDTTLGINDALSLTQTGTIAAVVGLSVSVLLKAI